MTDIDKRAARALNWIDQASLATDDDNALLYLFFALETLLGDKSEGLKADALAYRQLLLSQVVRGWFKHPTRAWNLYALVRSTGVHGEDPPAITAKTLRSFTHSVHETFADYLRLAARAKLTRRSRLLAHLHNHADRAHAVEWIRIFGGPEWDTYLKTLSDCKSE